VRIEYESLLQKVKFQKEKHHKTVALLSDFVDYLLQVEDSLAAQEGEEHQIDIHLDLDLIKHC
jgi:hypothetical protein